MLLRISKSHNYKDLLLEHLDLETKVLEKVDQKNLKEEIEDLIKLREKSYNKLKLSPPKIIKLQPSSTLSQECSEKFQSLLDHLTKISESKIVPKLDIPLIYDTVRDLARELNYSFNLSPPEQISAQRNSASLSLILQSKEKVLITNKDFNPEIFTKDEALEILRFIDVVEDSHKWDGIRQEIVKYIVKN